MRLLLDENVQARVAVALSAAGHACQHLSDLSLLGAPDDVVLHTSVEQARILVTSDTDFGAILALSGAHVPSVLLLRT